ncbi:MAG: hypothetical protein OHK93_005012 [Ramalina farinacea]|uniref:Uncharacterized protein n=1 Tax=Ramalina farinacea TaxID=258253 RepID=A0AA43QX06_9LECA|nr:hypothetical protein [Ramalina farinacea]
MGTYDINTSTITATLIMATGIPELVQNLKMQLSESTSDEISRIHKEALRHQGAEKPQRQRLLFGMLKVFYLRKIDEQLIVGFSKSSWKDSSLNSWSRQERLSSMPKGLRGKMASTRKKSSKILKSAFERDQTFANFQSYRNEIAALSRLESFWTQGIALRFADLEEAVSCLKCCADPRCASLNEAGWSKAIQRGLPANRYKVLDCAEVETAAFLLLAK